MPLILFVVVIEYSIFLLPQLQPLARMRNSSETPFWVLRVIPMR
jgi:hypothetical protein